MTKVLIITGDGAGPEAEYGLFRMREEYIGVTVVGPTKKTLFTVFHQQEPGWDQGIERPWYPLRADAAFDEIDASDYDGLLLPGGRAPVYLRNNPSCMALVRHFVEAGKPVAAICRGPILLVSAGVVDVPMTGHPLIRPRVEMGGCKFVETRDEAVRHGQLVTVSGQPFQHVWVREFLNLLRSQPGTAEQRRRA
ncbi:MAG: intracellular protease, PfpI family [Hyphomicrobiales bacterium]|nr:intracellular protease, PfpI family [Hyphomicrobiales bacterium]